VLFRSYPAENTINKEKHPIPVGIGCFVFLAIPPCRNAVEITCY